MQKYKFSIEGLTPMLMHRNPMLDDEEVVVSGGKKGDDRYPADKWKQYLYLDSGTIVMPESNIKAALEKAGARISIGNRRTLKMAAASAIFFDDLFVPLLINGKVIKTSAIEAIKGSFDKQQAGAEKLGFTLDVRPASVNSAKHIRVRPRFQAWSIIGTFDTDDEELTEPRLKELFSLAGHIAGLCDYRPSSPKRPGAYGRFRAEIESA